MKRFFALILCLFLAAASLAAAENVTVTGKVTEIEKYGHASLDITIDAFLEAGFGICPEVILRAENQRTQGIRSVQILRVVFHILHS